MSRTVTRRMLAAWLREVGVDYVMLPAGVSSSASAMVPALSTGDPAAGIAPSDAAVETLDDIRVELTDCRRCPLCAGRATVVFGVGNPRARLMFVGEGPGSEEDRRGEPFVGAAGKRLDRWIERIGLRREDVYIANIVKCRPPGNRAPLPDEAKACLPYLLRQIRAIRPEIVCTLGATALNFLLGVEEKITRVRGRWRERDGVPVLPTYHPAFILRDPARETEVIGDFDAIASRLRLRPVR
ncbi:uracil-DNA glycosylase [Candidatus Deferrimicrobium sp.]|uniref:uracil-DNA glycosylase n=1 Tax=Candidatus Deferrimicrobium sp. TaxID=3060586 RepID=UPI003C5D5C67